MSNAALERIMRATQRRPTECDCPHCRKQCMTPCLGTPQDILRLIEAGYEEQLRMTFWCVGMLVGAIPFPVPMVQALQTPRGCIFFDGRHCRLHALGLKPTEGRLSHHILTGENLHFGRSLGWNVAKEWLNRENGLLVEKILSRFTEEEGHAAQK